MPAEGKCHFACIHSERKCQKNQGNEQHRGWRKKDNEMLPPGSVKGVASHLPIDRTNLIAQTFVDSYKTVPMSGVCICSSNSATPKETYAVHTYHRVGPPEPLGKTGWCVQK